MRRRARCPKWFFVLLLVLGAVAAGRPVTAAAGDWPAALGLEFTGFLEARYGRRLVADPHQRQASLAEGRLQLEADGDYDWLLLKFKGDLLADGVTEENRGLLRELYLLTSPLEFADLKVGRQVLTWGTGDLLFINDLFPKDWQSFFCGRDSEYLKAPADAARLSLFFDLVNLDLVYVPCFNPSTYITGERLSYWNPALGRLAGNHDTLHDENRNRFFTDDEFAGRLYRTFGNLEAALYFYDGFWKTPEGLNPANGKLFFPRLRVLGASLRSHLLGGVGNLETGYYDSRDDRDGDDPLVRNSEWRFLAGYERELARDFTGGLQYYLEYMQDYANYKDSLPPGQHRADEYRSVFTLRLTRLLLDQNLTLSLFTYYSPTDEDAYLRPKASYKVTDDWLVEAGGNLFFGAHRYTFFGQFQDNTNLYLAMRRSF
ncbi:MAG: hypothetical protein JRJ56_08500 [Deltaproteobacteria bacterium]|nr:hypothetical protein [Deltaproteobacteria bacterium]